MKFTTIFASVLLSAFAVTALPQHGADDPQTTVVGGVTSIEDNPHTTFIGGQPTLTRSDDNPSPSDDHGGHGGDDCSDDHPNPTEDHPRSCSGVQATATATASFSSDDSASTATASTIGTGSVTTTASFSATGTSTAQSLGSATAAAAAASSNAAKKISKADGMVAAGVIAGIFAAMA